MTDQDVEVFAELVNGAIDYRNGSEVVICARKGCRLYLRRNAKAPLGCHFALAAMTVALNRTAVCKIVQTGLKGWNSNGRMDVDYCPTKNPRSKIGNAVSFTPRAVACVQHADVLHYLAILSMELKEKLRLAGVF